MKCQQTLGTNLKEIPELENLEQNFHHSKNVFYLYLLFSTHIVGRYQDFKSLALKEKRKLSGLIDEHFSLIKFLVKLQDAKISIREIYLNPTKENCQKIIDILTLPKETGYPPLFEYKENSSQNRNHYSDLHTEYDYLLRNVSSWSFEKMISKTVLGDHRIGNFQDIAPHVLEYVGLLEKRFEITQTLLKSPSKPLDLLPEDADFLRCPFPIILVYNSDNNMRILSMNTQEYRAHKSLTFGKDIEIIATYNEENKRRLQDYVARHQLNMTVVTFDDLKRFKSSLFTSYPITLEEALKPSLQPKAKVVEFKSKPSLSLPDSSGSTVSLTDSDHQLLHSSMENESKSTQVEGARVLATQNQNAQQASTLYMPIVSGFIAVLGVAAVAVAFTALNAASLGTVGLIVAGIGSAAILSSVGLFASNYLNDQQHRADININLSPAF